MGSQGKESLIPGTGGSGLERATQSKTCASFLQNGAPGVREIHRKMLSPQGTKLKKDVWGNGEQSSASLPYTDALL